MNTTHPIRPRPLPRATSRADLAFCGAHSSARAFSLIELVVVLAIIAAISSIALVRYSSSLSNYRLNITAAKIRADLEWARTRAQSTSSERQVRFVPDSNGYGIPAEPLRPNSSSRYLVDLTQSPYGVKLVSATFGSGSSVTFNAFGLPNSAGTVRVSAGSSSRTIRVSAGGALSVETP